MNLEEMGLLLRQERERRGISLEKAAGAVRISKKYLASLEEGRTDGLPHPVYAKGFVKNYARFLELDPEEFGEVLGRYYVVDDNHLRDAPRYEVKESSPSIRERGTSSSSFKPSLWLGIPVVLAAFGLLVWFFFTSSFWKGFSFDSVTQLFSSSVTQAPATSEPAKADSKTDAKADAGATEAAPATPAKPQAAESAPTVQRDLLALTPSSSASGKAQSDSGGDLLSQMAAEAQFADKGSQVTELTANQPAKLTVTDESGQSRDFSLVKGQRLTLRFQNKLTVRFGSAPSMSVKLNGKDYSLGGGKADGRTIQFP